MFSMNLMYKYVDFIVTFILDTLFLIIFMLSNMCYDFSLLNDSFSIILCEKSNWFKYSSTNINSFCFIINNATLVQIFFCERKRKRKITVKNIFTKNCNTMVVPAKKIFQLNQCWIWIYVKQRIISIFFLQYVIWEFASWFLFSLPRFNTTSWANLSPLLAFSKGLISLNK